MKFDKIMPSFVADNTNSLLNVNIVSYGNFVGTSNDVMK